MSRFKSMLKLNWFIRQALSFLLLALTLAAPHGAVFAEGNSGSTTTKSHLSLSRLGTQATAVLTAPIGARRR